ESAFWRLVPGERAPWRRRVRAAVTERLNRACVERSEISTFTHDGYRRSLLRRHAERGHVVEASWIDHENVLDDAQLSGVIERRSRHAGSLKLVFVGRLTPEKGLLVLLDAVESALREKVAVQLDIFGDGPLREECARRIRALGESAPVQLRGTMPYDQRFFEAMRAYDALVVPSISDEQPRVVFDAYAQGLPVIASRTEGLVQCVDDHVTGFLVAAGDHVALRACIARLAARPEPLAAMSRACVNRAQRLTHRQMHRARWQLLVDRFPALTRPP
ncbi:MAG: glycosyltransferase family 4 protein, partial [Rhizobiales bacterium]|nr:glycosyltransferase family 4 protein [Rhizobacter sp.]